MDLQTLLQFFPPGLRTAITSPDVSDVMVNQDGRVFADIGGRTEPLFPAPIAAAALLMGVQSIARRLGGDLDENNPILDARLPDGSRVAAVLSDKELTVTIRKFNRWFTAKELVGNGTLPAVVEDQLYEAIRESRNILVSGGTGSGKTTLAAALLDHAPETDRLIVIEKPRELRISQPDAVRWEAQEAQPGRAAMSVAQLVAAALRHRPDRIVLGEVREPEAAYQLLQAMNTGHSGTLSTIHADSALDALYRLSDLALAAHSNLSADFVRAQVARCIRYVVHIERARDGKRRVTELARLHSYQQGVSAHGQGEFRLEMLYESEEAN